MIAKTQKDRILYLLIRETRSPHLSDSTDLNPSVFDKDVFVAYGAQTISCDFNPYYVVHKDIYGVFQLFRFSHVTLVQLAQFEGANVAMKTAYNLSIGDMNAANSVMRMFHLEPLISKCLVCQL